MEGALGGGEVLDEVPDGDVEAVEPVCGAFAVAGYIPQLDYGAVCVAVANRVIVMAKPSAVAGVGSPVAGEGRYFIGLVACFG